MFNLWTWIEGIDNHRNYGIGFDTFVYYWKRRDQQVDHYGKYGVYPKDTITYG